MNSRVRPPREHVRVQIQTLAKEGKRPEEIAIKLGVSRTTVFKWKDKNIQNTQLLRQKINQG